MSGELVDSLKCELAERGLIEKWAETLDKDCWQNELYYWLLVPVLK
jgi:hypothetical protein